MLYSLKDAVKVTENVCLTIYESLSSAIHVLEPLESLSNLFGGSHDSVANSNAKLVLGMNVQCKERS